MRENKSERKKEEKNIIDCFQSSSGKCLSMLRSVSSAIPNTDFLAKGGIEKFCLQNASIILCTASGSIKLYAEDMTPIKYVIIDEAAQLKELASILIQEKLEYP